MMKKTMIKHVVLSLIILSFVLLAGCGSQSTETLTIGAILPLSGPASIWGVSVQEGMDLAQEELAQQGINLNIIYEDSQAKATMGVSAYNKLTNIDNVDVIFSALSSVSVPLVPLADADEMPLVVTLVAAQGIADKSPFTFRFYPPTEEYVNPHFEKIDKETYDEIAILYVKCSCLGDAVFDIHAFEIVVDHCCEPFFII